MVVLKLALASWLAAQVTWAQVGETGPNNDTESTQTLIEDEITIHRVTVGLLEHEFHPNSIIANPGDKVVFEFYPGNHSVIESLYKWPCIPKEAVIGGSGFNSKPRPVVDKEHPTTWNLTVNNTDTTYYYCGAPGSCVNYGMLGVINPTSEDNLTAQIEMAKRGRYVLYPGQTLPNDAKTSVSALAASVLAESDDANPKDDKSSGLSTGAIVGIAIGGVAALLIVGALVFYFGRNRGQLKALQETVNRAQAPPATHAAPEMTVDGVTYVPATDPRASAAKQSFLPPYQHYGPDYRSKSPETISSHAHSTLVPSTYAPCSPQMNVNNRYSDQSEQGFYAPTPRHELHAQPTIPEHDSNDAEGRPTYL